MNKSWLTEITAFLFNVHDCRLQRPGLKKFRKHKWCCVIVLCQWWDSMLHIINRESPIGSQIYFTFPIQYPYQSSQFILYYARHFTLTVKMNYKVLKRFFINIKLWFLYMLYLFSHWYKHMFHDEELPNPLLHELHFYQKMFWRIFIAWRSNNNVQWWKASYSQK